MKRRIRPGWLYGLALMGLLCAHVSEAEERFPVIFPEARSVTVREPWQLPPVAVTHTERPPTVASPPAAIEPRYLALDDAIRTALANSEVVRVLAGIVARNSGRTVYDVAAANTAIDQQQAQFDPRLTIDQQWFQQDTPSIPAPPQVLGTQVEGYNFNLGLNKTTVTGGGLGLNVQTSPTNRPGLSQTPSSFDLSVRQPLLRGGGREVNLVPIVLARIDTERSYFQLKSGVQELVRGVIDAYWRLILARTNVWVRRQQIEQLDFAYRLARAQQEIGIVDLAVVSQARVALANFRATLIAAEADVLDREAALRSLLGFPPYDDAHLVPTTPPRKDPLPIDWNALVELAAEQRPDIIELKLILEADEQRLLLAENQALPNLDAQALYRWNGLEGEVPPAAFASRPGQFTDWTFSINFSVPLGLRSERASLRSRELTLARDRANLEQSVLEMSHLLAANLRSLDLFYEQYLAFQETREAARVNLEFQLADFQQGRIIFLTVLQAISDWGNAVSSEAQTLLSYNLELANLELQTGSILESHGVRFYEEIGGSIGPLGRHYPAAYPTVVGPTLNGDRYESGTGPAEESFELIGPSDWREQSESLLQPQRLPEP